jgi:hypothetical protein
LSPSIEISDAYHSIARFSIDDYNQTTGAIRESIPMDWIGLDWYNYPTGYEYIRQLRYIDNIKLDAS